MELQSKLLALIGRACVEERAVFDRLSDKERSTPGAPDHWSPKDEIVHVAGWTMRLAENLAAATSGGLLVRYDDYEAVNAREFTENRDLAWSEVLDKAAEACHKLAGQVEARSAAELRSMDTLPWQEGRPLWRLIAGSGYIHPMTMHVCPMYIARGDQAYATRLQEEGAQLLGELDDARDWHGLTRYNLACHYALVGEAGMAIDELGKALELNPGLTEWSKADPDLASIRGEPGCQALYADAVTP
ncbi:MAG: ClbS/DfsB family four-helix bundle protein [Chloroflexi bacterium]|nr:ClbS/DfsB family four-helix bundle protein [Chloroflexota bacterium]MBU1748667.1 ClbS/DfsB family four-helix bundle protein [Chloroflexota bacterium]MBU1878324.1 ClbS/DfsB family four-helix bundle protein [Chloroflexota bacterium]